MKKEFHGNRLKGYKALVTAGPTYEAIDPVRFIGNYSSGKMGVYIANELKNLGADVCLIQGFGVTTKPLPGIKIIKVTSSDEMYKECIHYFPKTNITVMAAAVADFKPEVIKYDKIKKTASPLILKLIHTKDILTELGKRKRPGQLLIGFALETGNKEKNALVKLKKKNLDAIILNSPKKGITGPGSDKNKITIFDSRNKKLEFKLKPKTQVASDIAEYICIWLKR